MKFRIALATLLTGALGAGAVAVLPAPVAGRPVGGSVAAGADAAAARVASWDDSGRIFLWDESGSLLPGWPVAASGAWPIGTPRLQDLDGDGQPEVLCLLKSWDLGRTVRAWRLDGQPWPGHAPVACPADMADTPEHSARVGGPFEWTWPTEGGAVARSLAWDPGAQRPGFPVSVAPGRLRLRLADVDGDGVPEVLGGVEEGATGRWFVVYPQGCPPTVAQGATVAPVTAAPVLVAPGGGWPVALLVAMSGRLQRWNSDDLLGFDPAPGWPVPDGAAPQGAPVVLSGAARPALGRGGDGRLAAFSAAGQPLRAWADGVRLGVSVESADLPSGVGRGGWVQHAGGSVLRFQSEAGSDSTGRPRLFTRELGNRHHGANTSAPAGLLPPVQFSIWLNGSPALPAGTVTRVTASDVEVRGAPDYPAQDASVEASLVVSRGATVVGRVGGTDALRLQLHLECGAYRAVVLGPRDTLACAQFVVEPKLVLDDVYNYPNPARVETDFLFRLSRPAQVSIDVFTVAGRRVRSLRGDFGEGRQRLGWDGRDAAGSPAANGVYLYRVAARSGGEHSQVIGKLIRMN
jgi:hypothetical protein